MYRPFWAVLYDKVNQLNIKKESFIGNQTQSHQMKNIQSIQYYFLSKKKVVFSILCVHLFRALLQQDGWAYFLLGMHVQLLLL